MNRILISAIFCLAWTFCLSDEYCILDYGATGNGKALCTRAIQAAVDDCSARGGGKVIVPPGDYYTGAIFLRSFVELHLEEGAQLIGSVNYDDYPDLATDRKGVVNGFNVHDAAITGFGVINGNGGEPAFQLGGNGVLRPYLLVLNDCRKMNIQDITLVNSSFWTFRIRDCEEVFVRGLKIFSHTNFNNDGIDIDGKNIIVSDCLIDATDDGICFKSDNPERLCENVTVTNCIVASNCNAIKFGTASRAGFRNIAVSNCVIKTPANNDLFAYPYFSVPGVTASVVNNSGISIEEVDAGALEKITITNITMENVLTPLFIRLGQRNPRPVKYLKDVVISNIVATGVSHMSCSITGIPGSRVENVKISNVILNYNGGGLKNLAHKEVPEQEKAYPENKMFGPSLPAYGFFIRHADNITLDNIHINLLYNDERYAFYLEDAHHICLNGVTLQEHMSPLPVFKIKDCENLTISGFRAYSTVRKFIEAEGNNSHVKIVQNDLANVKKIVSGNSKGLVRKFNIK